MQRVLNSTSRRYLTTQMRSMSSWKGQDFDTFIHNALEESGLGEFTAGTLEQLKSSQVINTAILFKLTDPDFKAAGLSVGTARAIKDAIAAAKREEIVEKAGERADIRRSLSLKQKRGF